MNDTRSVVLALTTFAAFMAILSTMVVASVWFLNLTVSMPTGYGVGVMITGYVFLVLTIRLYTGWILKCRDDEIYSVYDPETGRMDIDYWRLQVYEVFDGEGDYEAIKDYDDFTTALCALREASKEHNNGGLMLSAYTKDDRGFSTWVYDIQPDGTVHMTFHGVT